MSNLSAFPYIAERSEGTPGLWNYPLSIISANIAALDSGLTSSSPSGNTFSFLTNIETSGGAHFQYISVGSTPPSYVTTAAVTIEVNSSASDYLYFIDSSAQRSSYLMGSRAGGTGDGLNIYDVSGGTMIVGFSKQSTRFYSPVVAPLIDVGGAVVNVRAFGAIGDGVTDDTASINLALASLPNPGGIISFSRGTYLHSGLTIAQRVLMVGQPGGAVALLYSKSTGTSIVFNYDNSNLNVMGCGMQYINIVGQGQGGTNTSGGILIGGNGSPSGGGIGFQMYGCRTSGFSIGLAFFSNTFLNWFVNSIWVTNTRNLHIPSAATVFGESTVFQQCTFANAGDVTNAVYLESGTTAYGLRFEGCSFDNCQFVNLSGSTGDTNISLMGCHWENLAGLGSAPFIRNNGWMQIIGGEVSQDIASPTMASLISTSGGVLHVSDLDILSLHAGSAISAVYTVNGTATLFERGTNVRLGTFPSLLTGSTSGKIATRDNSHGANYTSGGVESRPMVVPAWAASITADLSQGRDFRINGSTAITATIATSNMPPDPGPAATATDVTFQIWNNSSGAITVNLPGLSAGAVQPATGKTILVSMWWDSARGVLIERCRTSAGV